MALDSVRTAIWLDCDPGHDDALAIVLAGHDPRLQLIGVSTVHGNQSIERTTINALTVLHAAGLSSVPVVRGAARPLLRAPKLCPEVHGASGLDGALLPAPEASALPGVAANVIFERLAAHAERTGTPATIVATGALTNIALLLAVHGDAARRVIYEVVFMGGSTGRGNTGPVAEFNVQIDPEAAAMVLASGLRVTMVPLDVTHTALCTPEVLARVALRSKASDVGELGAYPFGRSVCGDAFPAPEEASVPPPPPAPVTVASPFRGALGALLTFFAGSYRDTFGMPHPPLHDPCAVALVASRGALFTCRRVRVEVETGSAYAYGATVCDLHGVAPPVPPHLRRSEWDDGSSANASVALSMDVRGFWGTMMAAIDAADTVSPMNAAAAAP